MNVAPLWSIPRLCSAFLGPLTSLHDVFYKKGKNWRNILNIGGVVIMEICSTFWDNDDLSDRVPQILDPVPNFSCDFNLGRSRLICGLHKPLPEIWNLWKIGFQKSIDFRTGPNSSPIIEIFRWSWAGKRRASIKRQRGSTACVKLTCVKILWSPRKAVYFCGVFLRWKFSLSYCRAYIAAKRKRWAHHCSSHPLKVCHSW